MSRVKLAALLFVVVVSRGAAAAPIAPRAEHVVVVVWDGMRPDLITPENCPTLAQLAHDGVFFAHHHSAFPSSTNVNGAVLATGDYPAHNGIISNHEYRAEIDSRKPFDTSDFPALDAAEGRVLEKYLAVPTIAELVQKAGFRTAVAGSKPVAQLADRARRRPNEKSIVIYRGKALPRSAAAVINRALGPMPPRKNFPNHAEDDWTTDALTEVLWKEEVPKFSLLWLSEPDLSQHETAPGSPTALAAIRNDDQNLAKILAALRAKNALAGTDLFVVSDHGFSTVARALDLAENLRAAGFDAVRSFRGAPRPGQVLVVSLGGSSELYVIGHERALTQKLVDFLQRSDFAGVILTREKMEGTFTLSQLHLQSPTAPDIIVASRWNDQPNEYGIRGEVCSDLGKNAGQGTHSTLSPHDLHNTLVASGPDFRRGWKDEAPTGNIDVAPTVLALLGINAPAPQDGRILREAFRDAPPPPPAQERALVATRNLDGSTWRQTLRLTSIGATGYVSEGNGARVKARAGRATRIPAQSAPR